MEDCPFQKPNRNVQNVPFHFDPVVEAENSPNPIFKTPKWWPSGKLRFLAKTVSKGSKSRNRQARMNTKFLQPDALRSTFTA